MIVDAGCEVGLHGYAHELNTTLSPDKERWVMTRSQELVERLSGRPASGYRAPRATRPPRRCDCWSSTACTYDSSLMGHDYRPYRMRLGDELPEDGPARWGPETDVDRAAVQLDARRLRLPRVRDVPAHADAGPASSRGHVRQLHRRRGLDGAGSHHGVCNVVFHPQVIGRGHRLLALERWLDEIAGLGVTFARMDHVAEAFAAGRSFGLEPSWDAP